METPCVLGNAYVADCFCLAKFGAQHRTEYSAGIVLDTGAHAVLLSTYLLGAAAVLAEREIYCFHTHYPAMGRWWLLP